MANRARAKPVNAGAGRVVAIVVMLTALMRAGVGATEEPVEITLERTAYFGWCPDYTVTISDDGTVAHEGRRSAGLLGSGTLRAMVAAVPAAARGYARCGRVLPCARI